MSRLGEIGWTSPEIISKAVQETLPEIEGELKTPETASVPAMLPGIEEQHFSKSPDIVSMAVPKIEEEHELKFHEMVVVPETWSEAGEYPVPHIAAAGPGDVAQNGEA